jgi:chitinase
VVGYFAQWGVYARNCHVKNCVDQNPGVAKLTHINYAFGNVTGGACVLGDTYADYDRFYDAASSVSGVSDTWDVGALRGSFNQLRQLKAKRGIRNLFAFGGWTWSGGFGQAAANATNFANSCYNLLHDARWADVWDGIDMDWEYPNACGLSCDASGYNAFGNLMGALNSRFGSQLVTAAVTADSKAKFDAANYCVALGHSDWFNVMTYDFFGAWAAQGPTAMHSALYSWPAIPGGGQEHFFTDSAIQRYKGCGNPGKIHIGIPFYGRGWTGVTQAAPGGSATGAAPGTYEAGIEDYKVLANRSWTTLAGTSYSLSGGVWWSLDTPSNIAGKKAYKNSQSLGGMFFWEFNGDNGQLLNAF